MELLFIFIILLILSAFFSGTETAYFHIRQHRDDIPEKVKSILDHPRRLLVSLLTGNTIVNVAMASIAAYIAAKYAYEHDWDASIPILIEVIIVSVVVLIFGEILPKMAAIRKSEIFAKRVYSLLKIIV